MLVQGMTIQPPDRLAAAHDALARRLAELDAQPDTRCASCHRRSLFRRITQWLCQVCQAWAVAVIQRYRDQKEARKVQLAYIMRDALGMLARLTPNDIIALSAPLRLIPTEDN